MNEKVTTDATVSFRSATTWVETLYREDPNVVIDRAIEAEPYVMALAAHVAKRTEARLMRNGVAEHVAGFVHTQICCAGALSVELMKKGHALLFSDLIDPESDNRKGVTK